jgi:hypothetical protein
VMRSLGLEYYGIGRSQRPALRLVNVVADRAMV